MNEGIISKILGEFKPLPLTISILVAVIPILIWFYLFFSAAQKSKKTAFIVFGISCISAPALLYLQYLWDEYPNFNLQHFIESNVNNTSLITILVILLFVIMEETIKLFVVKVVDKKTLLISNINDAIKYSIISALGFAFIENAYYFYQYYPSSTKGELFGLFIFRSAFTTCAHMIFTGVFGYHYGIGKYAMYISKQKELTGGISKLSTWISRTFNIPLSEGFRQKTVMKGFLLATIMHLTYNVILTYNSRLPVIIFVICGYLYLQYLLKRKVGHLILTTDPATNRPSTIAKKDKDVILELLGMWFKEKRYVDVIHICGRLLERDPDNNVVKIFKAKAMDNMENSETYKKILGTVIKTKEDLSENQRNTITKYITEKKEEKKMVQTKSPGKIEENEVEEKKVEEVTYNLGL